MKLRELSLYNPERNSPREKIPLTLKISYSEVHRFHITPEKCRVQGYLSEAKPRLVPRLISKLVHIR
jgi:hypothetical protein